MLAPTTTTLPTDKSFSQLVTKLTRDGQNVPVERIDYLIDFIEEYLPLIEGGPFPRGNPGLYNAGVVTVLLDAKGDAQMDVVVPTAPIHNIDHLKVQLSAFNCYLSFRFDISSCGKFQGGIYRVRKTGDGEDIAIHVDDEGRVSGNSEHQWNGEPYLDQIIDSFLDLCL